MRIAYFYDPHSTSIGTVFDHAAALSQDTKWHIHYFPVRGYAGANQLPPKNGYDWIICHYSVRLPGGTFKEFLKSLVNSKIPKALFIQDEYDKVQEAHKWMKRIKFNLVFTCVPHRKIPYVYPKKNFPGTTFVSVLTGYVPLSASLKRTWKNHSRRFFDVGYRGRKLPYRYGILGQMKYWIGKNFPADKNLFKLSISSAENDRLYGNKWVSFLENCRCTLGAESGCNIFDWDGSIAKKEADYLSANKNPCFKEFYHKVLKSNEPHNIMNQISPRVFEAIAQKTTLLLFKGKYSNILQPHIHYFPIEHNYSNANQLINFIQNKKACEKMAKRAYKDIIKSEKYSYKSFSNIIKKNLTTKTHKHKYKEKNQTNYQCDENAQGVYFLSPLPISKIKDLFETKLKIFLSEPNSSLLDQNFYPVANSRRLFKSLGYLFLAKLFCFLGNFINEIEKNKIKKYLFKKNPQKYTYICERINLIEKKVLSPF